MATSRDALRSLLAEQAIVRGPITLSSGSVSAYYFDCRRVTLSAQGASIVGEVVADVIDGLELPPRAIGGLAHGADPIVSAAIIRALDRGRRLDGFYVRKAPKDHGTEQWIENQPAPGTPVVIVDDVVTSGGSVIQAIERAGAAGCRVVGVIALVDRLEGGRENIRKHAPDAKYVPIFDLTDFPEIERITRELTNDPGQLSRAASR